ncbi:Integrator complex subunit 7, partial [Lobulomyces angularis]
MISDEKLEKGLQHLLEFDREFRSIKVEDSNMAVLKFITFFEEYKDIKTLINSAFSKLAEYWRTSNNFTRESLLIVFKNVLSHFKNTTNYAEQLRSVGLVLESNDPVARSLTLRLLGYLHEISSDRIEIYHLIHEYLDSKYDFEVKAAIFITNKFCSKSLTFSIDVSEKLINLINDPKINNYNRLSLVNIFKNMTFNPSIANQSYNALIKFYKKTQFSQDYYTVDLAIVILKTTTELAKYCIFHEQDHVELLFSILTKSWKSELLCFGALNCLQMLSNKTSLFSESNFLILLNIFENTNSALNKNSAITLLNLLLSDKLYKFKLKSFFLLKKKEFKDYEANFFKLLTNEILQSNDLKIFFTIIDIILKFFEEKEKYEEVLQQLLKSIVSNSCAEKIDLLVSRYISLSKYQPDVTASYIKNLISELSKVSPDAILPETIIKVLNHRLFQFQSDSEFLNVAENMTQFGLKHGVKPSVYAFICLNSRSALTLTSFSKILMEKIQDSPSYYWDLYKIAEKLICEGNFQLSNSLFVTCLDQTETECSYFWLSTLIQISAIESSINQLENLNNIESCLQDLILEYDYVILNLQAFKPQIATRGNVQVKPKDAIILQLEKQQLESSFQLQFSKIRKEFLFFFKVSFSFFNTIISEEDFLLFFKRVEFLITEIEKLSSSFLFMGSQSNRVLDNLIISLLILLQILQKFKGINNEKIAIKLMDMFPSKKSVKDFKESLSKLNQNKLFELSSSLVEENINLEKTLFELLKIQFSIPRYFFVIEQDHYFKLNISSSTNQSRFDTKIILNCKCSLHCKIKIKRVFKVEVKVIDEEGVVNQIKTYNLDKNCTFETIIMLDKGNKKISFGLLDDSAS